MPIKITDIIFQFSKEHPFYVIIYILLLGVLPIQEIVLPHFYGKLIQAIQTKNPLWNLVIIIIFLILILQIGNFVIDYVEMQLYPRLTIFIRKYILNSVVRSISMNYSDIKSGNVLSQIVKMPNYMYNYINQLKTFIIPQFVVMILAGIYFMYNDLLLGVIFIVITLVFMILVYYTPTSCNHISVKREKTINKVVEHMDDILKNIISVFNANRLKKEYQTIDDVNDKYTKLSLDTLFCASKFKILLVPLQLGYFIFFIYRCYILVQMKRITTAQFISLFIIILYISGSMWKITGTLTNLTYQWGVINNALLQIDRSVMLPEKQSTYVLSQKNNGLTFENVTLVYPSNKIAIQNIFLHIPDKQKIAIIGHIGSGKSSLIKLLMKYYTPTSGDIFYDSISYSDISVQEIREKIGYIPQNPILFDRTIYENIVYGREDITPEQVRSMIHSLGLQNIFKSFPLELDTPVGKNGSMLSGGERQIVLILRIMFQNPKILLLDESTAAIDEKTKHQVFQLLQEIMKDKTVIMITHDDDMLRYADRTITIDHGTIIQDKNKRA